MGSAVMTNVSKTKAEQMSIKQKIAYKNQDNTNNGNSLPFKLRHKARNSPSDNISECESERSASPDLATNDL